MFYEYFFIHILLAKNTDNIKENKKKIITATKGTNHPGTVKFRGSDSYTFPNIPRFSRQLITP